MSRHRNVRTMDYSDDYEGFDDVYGHSVEEDGCISPSDAAEFMFDRTRQPQISSFFNEENDIAEEDETKLESLEQDKGKQHPLLNETDEARLRSCLDEIHNVIGDSVPDQVLTEVILEHDFNCNKALDAVLSNAVPSTEEADAPKPQRERRQKRDRDDNVNKSSSFSEFKFLQFQMTSVDSLKEGVKQLHIHEKELTSFGTFLLDQNVKKTSSLSELNFQSVKAKISPANASDNTFHFKPSIKETASKTVPNFQDKVINHSTKSTIVFDSPFRTLYSNQGFTSENSELSSAKKKNNSSNTGTKLNIPILKMKARKDSEKENLIDEKNLTQCLADSESNEIETPFEEEEETTFSTLAALANRCHGSTEYYKEPNISEQKLNPAQSGISSLDELANLHLKGNEARETESNIKVTSGGSAEVLVLPEEDFSSLEALAKKFLDQSDTKKIQLFDSNVTQACLTNKATASLTELASQHLGEGSGECTKQKHNSKAINKPTPFIGESHAENISNPAELQKGFHDPQKMSLLLAYEFAAELNKDNIQQELPVECVSDESMIEEFDNKLSNYCSFDNSSEDTVFPEMQEHRGNMSEMLLVGSLDLDDEAENDSLIDLTSALLLSRTRDACEPVKESELPSLVVQSVSSESVKHEIAELILSSNRNICQRHLAFRKKVPTAFGKIICRNWKQVLSPYPEPKIKIGSVTHPFS